MIKALQVSLCLLYECDVDLRFPSPSSLSLLGESWVQDADDTGWPVCQHSREATQNDRPA